MSLLDHRPESVIKRIGKNSKICLLNSRDIFNALYDKHIIIMACNVRIKHALPGIMRAAQEMDAVCAFELAKTEGDVNGGYTGQTPKIYADTILEYAEKVGYTKPFFIHADHITVKTTDEKDITSAEELIRAELAAGYTSFAIDASFNEIPDNIKITTRLVKPILEQNWGLEVEVGEVKAAGSEGAITTVEEAEEYIAGIKENNINANLLAINNGSKHGNYLEGEEVHIDLERTAQIYNDVLKANKMSIAQHGITGTPLHLMKKFAEYGIRKGNVATHWQNIAHEGLPEDLSKQIKDWCDGQGKNIKFAAKQFYKEIDSIPEENKKWIENKSYEEAKIFFDAFNAKGTARMLADILK